MEKNKVYQSPVIEFKDWDESIKSKIYSVEQQYVWLNPIDDGLEELYYIVCFKENKDFKGEKQLRKKIESLLNTKKILFYYNLPF